MFYSLFAPEVIAVGSLTGLACILLKYLRHDIAQHLRWVWEQLAGYFLIVGLATGLILLCRYVSQFSWAPTAYKWAAVISFVVTVLAGALVNGANWGRK